MGLSSLPSTSEGMLCIILVNTAQSISIFKGIVQAILHVVAICLSSSSASSQSTPSDPGETPVETFSTQATPSGSYIEKFRTQSPATRYDAVHSCKLLEHDCSVCLTEFKPESEINHLPCGHIFHNVCLEKWLDYWNFTCPLCRTPLLPDYEPSCLW